MLHYHLLLILQLVVPLVAFSLILLNFEGPIGDLLFEAVDTTLEGVDLLGGRFVLVE
jgi:hypothetical protein